MFIILELGQGLYYVAHSGLLSNPPASVPAMLGHPAQLGLSKQKFFYQFSLQIMIHLYRETAKQERNRRLKYCVAGVYILEHLSH